MVANKEEKTNHTHKLATAIEEEGCCACRGMAANSPARMIRIASTAAKGSLPSAATKETSSADCCYWNA
jgi:hypothetical protein